MPLPIAIAVVLAIPVVLLPVAFMWYLNIGGLASAVRGLRTKRFAAQKEALEIQPEQIEATE